MLGKLQAAAKPHTSSRTITRSQHHLRKRGTQRNRVIVHDQRESSEKYIEVLGGPHS
jgi:hypothetical protein